MIPYLVLIAVLVAAIIYFLVSGSGDGSGAETSDESVAQLLPEIASLLKPQFDVNKIKNFDFSIFKDPRLLNFSNPPPGPSALPEKGKDNPFAPPFVATSTASSTSL